MDRREKEVSVSQLKDKFQKASIAILTEYRGLNAAEMAELRSELKKSGDELVVAKNRLATIAIKGKEQEALKDYLKGPTAIIFGAEGNPVGGAKILAKYAEEHEKLVLKQAFMDGKVLEPKDVVALSQLLSKEELMAKLVGSLASPAGSLVRTINGVVQKMAIVLKAIQDQKEKG